MNQEEKIARIKALTPLLSEASRVYEQEDRELMSNFEYDRLYDELKTLEDETGIVLSDSPTHKVGFEVLSDLPKEKHESPMLSLNKTKSREELSEWLGNQKGVLSWKMDGLTVVLTYNNGELFKAVTRGNGEVGEVITNNVRVFKNVPHTIPFKGELVIRGEAIIRYSDFEKINAEIPDADAKYKNPRNLCSGSVRQLDNRITAQRSVYLYAFALISQTGEDAPVFKYRSEQLNYLEGLGFNVVERKSVSASDVADAVAYFADKITSNDFPSDGLVLLYDDIAYGNSLGRTAKFPRDGIAFKWADETAQTTLREIEWSASRTGLINPVAIFDSVELEGTTVSRASLHNISIMKELNLAIGDTITVYKANMIIPQLADNLSRSASYNTTPEGRLIITNSNKDITAITVAEKCPVCGQPTSVHYENDVMTLYCENTACEAKKIKLFAHLASRDALNIEGLSESTIEKLINAGILHTPADIFKIEASKERFIALEGLGEKSFGNLLEAVNKARSTTLARVIYSLGIPNIGLANARLISKYASEDPEAAIALSTEELITIDGIGDVLASAYTGYFSDRRNASDFRTLLTELKLEKEAAGGDALSGKVFVITGSVNHFANRNELKAYIESQGGKVTGSVTNKTDYLINNDITSNSSKNKTAKQLGVEIITEEDFLTRFGDK